MVEVLMDALLIMLLIHSCTKTPSHLGTIEYCDTVSMWQHSHSHSGGKCEHEAAGIGSRHRSPSPAARYAPIPTAEELTALGQSLRNAKLAEDGQRNQEHPEVHYFHNAARPTALATPFTFIPLSLTLLFLHL